MAVVDRDQVLAVRLHLTERPELLAGIDGVARDRRGVDIRAADESCRRGVASGEEAARLLRRLRASVGHDVVPKRRREREPFDQRPPAIAGMTMTSAPSGTAVPRPPEPRASASPT